MAARRDAAGRFIKAVDVEHKDMIAEFGLFQRSVAEYAYRQLVVLSPVWSGRYRGSHRISLGDVDETVLPEFEGPQVWPEEIPDANKFRAVGAADIQLQLLKLKPFDHITLSNSVPYAGRLEDGHSGQAPEGIFEVAATATRARFARVKHARLIE